MIKDRNKNKQKLITKKIKKYYSLKFALSLQTIYCNCIYQSIYK